MSLLRHDKQQKYVVFDYETESLRLHTKNRAWQLGYLIYQNNKVLELKTHYLFWEDLSVSEEAAKATRFNFQEWKRLAEDPQRILTNFNNLLNNPEYIIVGHNLLNFDVYVHNTMLLELGIQKNFNYLNRLIDTNCLAKMIKLDIKKVNNWYEDFLKFSNYVQKGLKTSLTTLGKEYGIDCNYEMLHDAGEDIKLNLKIFNQLINQIEI